MHPCEALGHEHLDGVPDELGPVEPEQCVGLGVDQHDPAVGVDDHHRVGGRLEQPSEEPLLAALVGDVADVGGDQDAVVGLQRTERDLDRELGAVLAPREEIQLRPHRPDVRLAQEPGAVVAVLLQEARGDQDLDRPADDLLPAIAEQHLDLRVHQDDDAVAVDHDHRVGGSLEQPAEVGRGPCTFVVRHHLRPHAPADGRRRSSDGTPHAGPRHDVWQMLANCPVSGSSGRRGRYAVGRASWRGNGPPAWLGTRCRGAQTTR